MSLLRQKGNTVNRYNQPYIEPDFSEKPKKKLVSTCTVCGFHRRSLKHKTICKGNI